jgi:hypothetical protein
MDCSIKEFCFTFGLLGAYYGAMLRFSRPIEDFRAKKVFLKRLGNPYAKLSVFDEEDFVREQHHAMGDQYAAHNLSWPGIKAVVNPQQMTFDSPKNSAAIIPLPINKRVQMPIVSLPFFKKRLREIFMTYSSPAERENGKISPHFSGFIKHYENVTGEMRHAILKEFEPFDLASLGKINPHYNRDDIDGIKTKLERIKLKYLV